MTEFEKYAIRGRGISSLSLHRFNSLYASYMNPMIIEEIGRTSCRERV